MESKTPGTLFLETVKSVPDLLAFVADDGAVNFVQFEKIVWSFYQNLSDLGVGIGDIVAVETDDPVSIFASILATSLLHAKWITVNNAYLLPPGMQARVILSSKEDSNRTYSAVFLDKKWFTESPGTPQRSPNIHPTGSWLLLSTSGTTGTPKLLGLSQAAMVGRAKALSNDFVKRKTVYCGLANCYAPPYLMFGIASLLNGSTIVRSYDFSLWKQAGVNIVHGSVAQVSGLLGEVTFKEKLPQIVVGGSSLSDALARHLLGNFEIVVEVYAATETNRSFRNLKSIGRENQIVTTGKPLDSEVEIVDENGKPRDPGIPGEVRVRNTYLCEGYLNHPEAQRKSFRKGWFYPGDFGYWGPNGNLCILGRASDILNIEGTKINASEIDSTLMSTPGISETLSFVGDTPEGGSELVTFATFQSGFDVHEVGRMALQNCQIQLGFTRTPKRLIEVEELPRASDGGSQRFLCAAIYRDLKSK